MSTRNQQALESEMSQILGKLECRFAQIGKSGLKYFTGVIGDILGDIQAARKAKEDTIVKELMLAESDIKSNSAEKALERIYKIKGLLVLALVFFNVFQVAVPGVRPMNRNGNVGLRSGMRFERVIGKKGGEA